MRWTEKRRKRGEDCRARLPGCRAAALAQAAAVRPRARMARRARIDLQAPRGRGPWTRPRTPSMRSSRFTSPSSTRKARGRRSKECADSARPYCVLLGLVRPPVLRMSWRAPSPAALTSVLRPQVGVFATERALAGGAKAKSFPPQQRVSRHAGPFLFFCRCVPGAGCIAGNAERCVVGPAFESSAFMACVFRKHFITGDFQWKFSVMKCLRSKQTRRACWTLLFPATAQCLDADRTSNVCGSVGVYTIFAALYLVCFQIEAPPGPFLVASGLADAAFIAGSRRCPVFCGSATCQSLTRLAERCTDARVGGRPAFQSQYRFCENGEGRNRGCPGSSARYAALHAERPANGYGHFVTRDSNSVLVLLFFRFGSQSRSDADTADIAHVQNVVRTPYAQNIREVSQKQPGQEFSGFLGFKHHIHCSHGSSDCLCLDGICRCGILGAQHSVFENLCNRGC